MSSSRRFIASQPPREQTSGASSIRTTRSLVIPVEPSAKGEAAVEGLESLVAGLESQLNLSVGVLAAVPVGFKDTRDQRNVLEQLEYSHPEVIGDRTSLMEGSWRQQCSIFRFVAEHRERVRDYEVETLAQFDRLARYLEEQAGIDAPSPPEPGALDHEVVA